MGRGASRATVHGIAKSNIAEQLSTKDHYSDQAERSKEGKKEGKRCFYPSETLDVGMFSLKPFLVEQYLGLWFLIEV